MIRTISLPFGDVRSVCTICGNCSFEPHPDCENSGSIWTPDVKIGDKVEVFERKPGKNPERIILKRAHTVSRLFYSTPGHRLGSATGHFYIAWRDQPLPTHTLCIELASTWDENGDREWRIGDLATVTVTLVYSDFLLWRDGNREKLENAGLIEPVKKKGSLNLFSR